jgi:hypothetical protein
MKTGHVLSILAFAAVLGAGCGDKCNTESPAKVSDVPQDCSQMQPGATVTVGIVLCPTCNQTGATCAVDTSQAASGFIHLDPTTEACHDASSCGNPSPTCLAGPTPCTFTAPTAAQPYHLVVFDPSTGTTIDRTFTVVNGGSQTSCGI